MRPLVIASAVMLLAACSAPNDNIEKKIADIVTADEFVDLSLRDKPASLITAPWDEVVISVPDMEDVSRLFVEIGDFETVKKTDDTWVLRAKGSDSGYVRLVKNTNPNAVPARPLDATAWDSGCYWSVMMRAKDIESIIADAKPLGWEPLTDIAFLEFGPSQLHIVVLRHQVTGAQVQLYERLTTPLPEGFTPFERLSRPFNIMQMTKDRDAAYDFFQQDLGMDTFYYGRPSLSDEEEINPLGIPQQLTTTVPYKAAIVTPFEGAEYGRFEMIEVDGDAQGLKGRDFSNRCRRQNWGIIEVHYKVDDLASIIQKMKVTGLAVTQHIPTVTFKKENGRYRANDYTASWMRIKSPDGAAIIFSEKE